MTDGMMQGTKILKRKKKTLGKIYNLTGERKENEKIKNEARKEIMKK